MPHGQTVGLKLPCQGNSCTIQQEKEQLYVYIPCTETPKPWYRAMGPPRAVVFFRQSIRPVNSLSAPPLPTSAASLVLAKSRGYTISRDPAPAKPPAAMLTAKNRQKSVLGLYLGNRFLMVSCKQGIGVELLHVKSSCAGEARNGQIAGTNIKTCTLD